MFVEKSQKLENKSQRKIIKNFGKIVVRFENYRRLLKKWIFLYIIIYSCWVLVSYFLMHWGFLKESFGKSSLKLFVALAMSLLRGLLFCLDGVITSQLKSPFGQICFYVNKSEEISEEGKDHIISAITESNEHCKETFKKFGVLTIAYEMSKIYKRLDGKKSQLGGNLNWESADQLVNLIGYSLLPLLSYVVPLFWAFSSIKKANKKLEEVWSLLTSANIRKITKNKTASSDSTNYQSEKTIV